jgi:hypothetical protein
VTYKGQTRPLFREGGLQRQDNKFQIQTLKKRSNIWSNVHKVGSTPRHTDWLSAVKWPWLWLLTINWRTHRRYIWGVSTTSRILKLSNRWRCVVSSTTRLPYSCEKYHVTRWGGGCVGPKSAVDVVKARNYTSFQNLNSRVHQPINVTLHYDLSNLC